MTNNVALLHHWLNGMRGGEKVLELFCQQFPSADIFTLFYEPSKISNCINQHSITASFLNRYGVFRKAYNNLFLLFPFVTEQFDLSRYELVLSSDTLSMKGVITNPDACHICYCHTPPRYVWDMYFEYLNNAGMGKAKRALAALLLHHYRTWDAVAANRVDYFIANSTFVAKRIAKYYRRSAVVINPPVRIADYSVQQGGEYYLALGQLVPYKRVDLLVDAFAQMPEKRLVVAGTGPLEKQLRKRASKNITFLGRFNEDEKCRLYQQCKAFLFPGIEDYGITPLEAQACGKPVIAIGRGGVLDTVNGYALAGQAGFCPDRHTGLFFSSPTVDAVKAAVQLFEDKLENKFSSDVIRKHAERYDEAVFLERMQAFVQEKCLEFSQNGPPLR